MKNLASALLVSILGIMSTSPVQAAAFVSVDNTTMDEETLSSLDKLIDEALTRLGSSSERFEGMLNSIVSSVNERAGTNRIRFREDPTGNFTTAIGDNYITISTYSDKSTYSRAASTSEIQKYQQSLGLGAPTAAVPEPATWAMMLVGFGGIGFAMRRRKSKVSTTVSYA